MKSDKQDEMRSSRVDNAFARLQNLYEQLDAMEKKGEKLVRAKQAQEALICDRELQSARALFDDAKQREDAAQALYQEAQTAQNDEEIAECSRALLQAGALLGFRVAPVQNGEKALQSALDAGSFASIEDARAALLGDEAQAALQKEVDEFREAYLEALSLCQKLEEDQK